MPLQLHRALPEHSKACVLLRGQTRENAVSEARLREFGITAESWAEDIASGLLPGWVAFDTMVMVGYCFGNARTGEVVVLAIHPSHEGAGLGRRLLSLVVAELHERGHTRLYLGCSSDPRARSHGFYRRLGWQSTGVADERGDEVLELVVPGASGGCLSGA
jgi:GNAT superfamily N-acetyltransferase